MRLLSAQFIGLSGLAMISPTFAAPFSNGSFESGGVSPWTLSGNVDRQNNTGNIYDGTKNNGYVSGASDGNYAVAFNDNGAVTDGTISQTFDTVAGQIYSVQFDYGLYGDPQPGGAASLVVSATDSTTNANLAVPATFTDSSGTPYELSSANQAYNLDQSYVFVAVSTSSVLTFSDNSQGVAFADTALDNVRVSAVPEPASIAVVAVSVVALAKRRRA